MPDDYRLEAKGVVWFEEISRSVSYKGETFSVPIMRIRPDALNDVRVSGVDRATARIDYDQDKR